MATMDVPQGHELHGARLVGQTPADDLVHLWTRVTSGIVKHGFAVEYQDLEPPRTGIFDGLKISIDPDVTFEMQCFLLLHLFGHSVQWVAATPSDKLADLQHAEDREVFMRVLHDYEFEAAGYGLTLLHATGATGFDQWYADFVHTDWRYVEEYYKTNQLPDWSRCVVSGGASIVEKPIPALQHHQVAVRFAF